MEKEEEKKESENQQVPFIKWLSELTKDSGQIAGGKGASLAEMFNAKLPVPPAFVVTTSAYNYFVEKTGIKEEIGEILDSINVDNTAELEKKAKQIRELMISKEFPEDLKEEIIEAYENLGIDKQALEQAKTDALKILQHGQEPVFTAVRSSATTEDLPDASFAGQQESYLNVKGNRDLIEKIRRVFASLFTARAIYYRKKRGFSKEKFALAAVVQKMIDSDKSGVMFSTNPIKQNDNIIIEAVFGLGEGIVSGKIKPDTYEITKELEIIDKKIAIKKIALTRDSQGNTEQVNLNEEISKQQVLEDSQIKSLANLGIKIEEHYEIPQDIEFAIENNEIFIVQSRPITTKVKEKSGEIKGKEILSGLAASPGVGSGKVKIIHDLSELSKVQKGDVLVTEMTNPDMVITMQKSAAIITDEGGLTCHAAIVSREMGIPTVVGTEKATKILKENQEVTVDGFNGKVYTGKSETITSEVNPIVPTKTKIKVIVDLPEAAERAAKTKADCIGLMRLEGIIASSGKHPIMFQQQNKLDEYTEILKKGIEKISQPFKEIWIRTSDIRSDEYANLEGAPKEKEDNPMLGMHGIRFSLKNPELLKAELKAIKLCADKYSDKTFGYMMPQVISPEEITETKKLAGQVRLTKVKQGIMVETPASALIIKHLLKAGVDFISFGTNDLTQYILAIDRNNEDVQYLHDEMHPAVLNAIKRVLRTCQEQKVETSICGQAGSKKEMAEFLVKNGIDSISVNADAAEKISKLVAELEKQSPENNQSPLNKQPQKFNNNKNKYPHQNQNKPNQNQQTQQEKSKPEENQENKNPEEKTKEIIQEINQKVNEEIKQQTHKQFEKEKQEAEKEKQQTQENKQEQKQPEAQNPQQSNPPQKPQEPEKQQQPKPQKQPEAPAYVADIIKEIEQEDYSNPENPNEPEEPPQEPQEPIPEPYSQYENNFQQEQIEGLPNFRQRFFTEKE